MSSTIRRLAKNEYILKVSSIAAFATSPSPSHLAFVLEKVINR